MMRSALMQGGIMDSTSRNGMQFGEWSYEIIIGED
jgi:hypothetical protein